MPNSGITINANDYRHAMRKLQRCVDSLIRPKALELCERLAKLGATVASASFDDDVYNSIDFNGGITVTTEKIGKGIGCKIIASGRTVAFAEFGTGVHAGLGYDGKTGGIPVYPGSYSQTVGKGQFIQGQHEYWYYRDVRFEGTYPRRGMYNAEKAIQLNVKKEAEEVFKSW